MTLRKVLLYTLTWPLVLFFIIIYLRRGLTNLPIIDRFYVLLFFFFCWSIGFVIGLIVSSILQKPSKDPYYYLSGQIFVVTVIASFILYSEIGKWLHQRRYGNIEFNHSLVGLDNNPVNDTLISQDVKVAFKKLESSFGEPNQFRLQKWFVSGTDSALSTVKSESEKIYFVYSKNTNVYFSLVVVVDDSAFLTILDGDPVTDKKYIIANRISQENWDNQFKELQKTLKNLPDSVKKQIGESLSK